MAVTGTSSMCPSEKSSSPLHTSREVMNHPVTNPGKGPVGPVFDTSVRNHHSTLQVKSV